MGGGAQSAGYWAGGAAGSAGVPPASSDASEITENALSDTAYDSDALRASLWRRGCQPIIPNNPTRKRHHPFDPVAHRERNVIERTFCRLKDWRRVATRYDKLAQNYYATVTLVAILLCWS